ncbi:MAG: glutathione transferase GstA [Kofleriaceae bacterium]|nr:MAG: glutathione transferase GstA [Kofleriaceae bacterium]MBZ0234540.1 glutathione transferase GstA [Kofleriaceae bacterium]
MKLYFTPGFCSLAPHIALRELELPFALERVSNRTKLTASGADYRAVSPLGYVPALELDDGSVLLETAAILVYLGDQKPEAGLVPAHGTLARYQLHAALSFVASELHKPFSFLLAPDTPEEMKAILRGKITSRIAHLATTMGAAGYAAGPTYSVADPYLFTVLGWAGFGKLDLTTWPDIAAYRARLASRPAVKAALAAEARRD